MAATCCKDSRANPAISLIGGLPMPQGRRSETTSRVSYSRSEKLRGAGFTLAYTMEDFERGYIKEHF